MCKPRHDIHSYGFTVDLEQLSHDLAIAKLATLNKNMNADEFYSTYLEFLEDFDSLIADKTRYDSSYSTKASAVVAGEIF